MPISTTAITGTLVNVNGVYLGDKRIFATIIDIPQELQSQGVFIDKEPIEATTNTSTGVFSIGVVSGATVRFKVDAVGYDKLIIIPNTGPVDFMALEEV